MDEAPQCGGDQNRSKSAVPQRLLVKEEAKSPSPVTTRAHADEADQTTKGSMSRHRRRKTRSGSRDDGSRRTHRRRRRHSAHTSEQRQRSPPPDTPAQPLGSGGKGPDPPPSGPGTGLLTGGSVSALLIHIGQALAQERGQ